MPSTDPRDAIIADQREQILQLQEMYAKQSVLLQEALKRIAELEDKLNTNSRNSSMPPSSDLIKPPSKRRKTGKSRRRGGQKGHKKHSRELLPVEEVDEIIRVEPKHCGDCFGTDLIVEEAPRVRKQVFEIPPIRPDVTEYQCYEAGCVRCGHVTRGCLPKGVPQGSFGPRLMSLVALSTTKYRVSKRGVKDLMHDFFGLDISLGMIPKIESKVSSWVAEATEEARSFVRGQRVVHMDETGWKENNKKAWMWIAVTSFVTVFTIARRRGSEVAKGMLGEGFIGFLVTDRWSAYSWVDPVMRQLCWAHLLRDFQKFVDRGGDSKHLGEALLDQAKLMFGWWHRVRDGTLQRATLIRRMKTVEQEVGRLLREATECDQDKSAATARDILRFEISLWTFVHNEGIEPTNNGGERGIRKGVMWRKTSFGTQGRTGSRYMERMLTVVETLRQQQRNVLGYLTEAGHRANYGKPPPSILPNRQ